MISILGSSQKCARRCWFGPCPYATHVRSGPLFAHFSVFTQYTAMFEFEEASNTPRADGSRAAATAMVARDLILDMVGERYKSQIKR